MAELRGAISNTSPLLYLYRIGAMDWLAQLFQEVWVPGAVTLELKEGQRKGYDVPVPSSYAWLKVVEPRLVEPWVDKLEDAGMWMSAEVRRRILQLAGEGDTTSGPS